MALHLKKKENKNFVEEITIILNWIQFKWIYLISKIVVNYDIAALHFKKME